MSEANAVISPVNEAVVPLRLPVKVPPAKGNALISLKTCAAVLPSNAELLVHLA